MPHAIFYDTTKEEQAGLGSTPLQSTAAIHFQLRGGDVHEGRACYDVTSMLFQLSISAIGESPQVLHVRSPI